LGKGILFDSTLCIGCQACSIGCKKAHNLAGEANPPDLDGETFTIVKELKGVFCRDFCRHCLKPACVSACPVGALHRLPDGPVVYDGDKCIGCRYCLLACPYNIPRYQWNKASPLVRKCDFCIDLLKQGRQTACAEVCPTGATRFGKREELLPEARERLKNNPTGYYQRIFGESEAGGCSVLLIAGQELADFGLKVPRIITPLPDLTWRHLKEVPAVAVGAGLILTGIWWLSRRKKEVAKAEACQSNNEKGHE